MDDGTPIKLKLTIDREEGSAEFDFEGTGPEVFGIKTSIGFSQPWLRGITEFTRHPRHL